MELRLRQKGIEHIGVNAVRVKATQLQCHFYAGAAVTIWGVANVVLKDAARYFYAPYLNVLRYLFAAIVMLLVIVLRKIPLPGIKDIPLVAFAGIMGFGAHTITLSIAVKTIPVASASLIVSTTPVWTAFLAHMLFSEHIRSIGWIAIGINVVGIIMLNASGLEKLSLNIGLFWAFLSALSMCFYNIAQRWLSRKYSALQTTAYGIIFSVILQSALLPGAVSEMLTTKPFVLGEVIFLGLVSSLAGFLLWSKALEGAGMASEVVNWMFVTPFVTTIIAFIFLDEVPDLLTILGGVTIIAGLVLFRVAAKQHHRL